MTYSVPSSWYDGLYIDRCEEKKSARSFSLTHNFYRAVLIVHGYAGYPGEMVSIARYLYSSFFDVYVPRLPGMGTSGEDFKASGLSDWLGVVDNALDELCLKYSEVYAFGHSMGCDLLALADNGRIKRAVMAAPAIKMKKPLNVRQLKELRKNNIVLDVPWQSDPEYNLSYDGAPEDDEYYGENYWSKLYPSQLLDLYDAMKKAQPLFDGNERYKILYGDQDALCSYSPTVLKNIVNKKKIKGGTHYLVYDKTRSAEQELLKESREFLDVRTPMGINIVTS